MRVFSYSSGMICLDMTNIIDESRMTNRTARAGHLARSLLLLTLLAGSLPALAAADRIARNNAAIAKELGADLARVFVLPKELALDPALRAEAEAMGAAHLVRIKQLLPAWVDEERRLQTTPAEPASENAIHHAVFARVLNELALWQVEPGDADYEQATLAALTGSPGVCKIQSDPRFQDFASRILRLQAIPPARRKAALDTERRLLARWGQPRASLPPWPVPLPQDAAMQAVEQIRRGGPRTTPAMPPALAYVLLAERKSYAELAADSKCQLQQWWLRASLAQGATPEAALGAFRYGTLISATDRFVGAFEPAVADPGAEPGYPKLAERFNATGVTIIKRPLDGAGKPGPVMIGERKITVSGIRGTRPVAFENAFDAVALHHARRYFDAQPSAIPALELVWTLNPSEPAATADAPVKKATP